ncbi:MAG: TonB family protein [Bacteroidia bacterium]|nr:TonB family protein [Bacteroidia bacterium]
MQDVNATTDKFDAYLERIEARERQQKRRQLFIGIGLLSVGVAGFAMFRMLSGPATLRTYALASLDRSRVESLFQENPAGIVVSHPDIGNDTIFSVEDYASLVSLVEYLEQPAFLTNETTDTDSLTVTEVSAGGDSAATVVDPGYFLDISNERVAGQEISFIVGNYNPGSTYLVDFGNGYRRTIRDRAAYTYPQAGRYTVRLISTDPAGNRFVTARAIRVTEPGAAPVSADNVVITDNTVAQPASQPTTQSTEPVARMGGGMMSGASRLEATNVNAGSITRKAEPEVRPTTPAPVTGPLIAAEVMPEYPGGMAGIARYISRNTAYPPAALDAGIQGVVTVRFVVNANGSVSAPQVIKGIGYGCDEEAVRIISRMSGWTPGKQGGQPVPVYFTLPVTFRMVK